MDTPNVFADQVEYMCKNFKDRNRIIVSVHPHNDRGTGVADAELALLAGADRVEGTLFGNGERTGNADVITVAYNMFSHGVNPMLNLENINEIIENNKIMHAKIIFDTFRLSIIFVTILIIIVCPSKFFVFDFKYRDYLKFLPRIIKIRTSNLKKITSIFYL